MALSQRPVALVLRALGLGDLLAGIPAMRAVCRALPHHEIVLATPRALQPLVELAQVADRVLPSAGLDPLTWKGEPPSVAVNLHGKGPHSHRVLLDLHPRRLIAFADEGERVAGPKWRGDEHEVDRWCRLIEESLEVPVDRLDLRLADPPLASPIDRAVVFHPGAAHSSRRWPVERFAQVAAWALSQGWPVAVTGSEAERPLAERVCDRAGLPKESMLAGRTQVLELAALVSSARLVVSGDTGVAHLASSYATPSLVLFGPVSPALWGPPRGPGHPHVALWHGDRAGETWADEVDPALLSITVAEVLAGAQSLLSPSDAA
ncbi:MAG: glycosyltransferase family 9 protein [Nocardioidaceae bacterium]